MARIVIDLPDSVNVDLGAAVCQLDGYEPTIEVDGQVVANPITPQQFVTQRFIGWAGNYLNNYRRPVDISQVTISYQ